MGELYLTVQLRWWVAPLLWAWVYAHVLLRRMPREEHVQRVAELVCRRGVRFVVK